MTNNKIAKKYAIYGWFVFALAALFFFYEYILRIAPALMSDELMRYFNLNAAGLGALSAFYYYAYLVMQVPAGVLMDRFGPRFLLTGAAIICAVGTAIFPFSHYIVIADGARLLIGFGSSFAFVGALKVAAIWLPSKRFAMIAGLTTTIGMIGGMVGNNGLTLLIAHVNWRVSMFLLAGGGALLAILLYYFVREKNHVVNPGAAEHKKVSIKVLLSELLLLLKIPQIWLIGFIAIATATSLSVFCELWGVLYLEQAKGFTASQAAALVSIVFLGWVFGAPFSGFVSDYLKDRRLPIIVGAFGGVLTVSGIIYVNNLPIILAGLLLFLFGICTSSGNISFAIAKDIAHNKLAASAMALINMFATVGGAILQPVVGIILDSQGDNGKIVAGVHYYTNHQFKVALLILPIFYLLSAFLSFFLKKNH